MSTFLHSHRRPLAIALAAACGIATAITFGMHAAPPRAAIQDADLPTTLLPVVHVVAKAPPAVEVDKPLATVTLPTVRVTARAAVSRPLAAAPAPALAANLRVLADARHR